MSDAEYLPAESEAQLPVAVSGDTQVEKPLLRVQCARCYKELGNHGGGWDDTVKLLEALGWRVGREIFCPDCVKERARDFLKKYQ